MESNENIREKLRSLFETQRLAVLATIMEDQPYLNIVAFSASLDLQSLFFATSRQTRKFRNLQAGGGKVSMLVDNRANEASDFEHATAVTVIGEAHELTGSRRETEAAGFLTKHPDLNDFIGKSDTALMCVEVSKYLVVTRFEHVEELVDFP